MSPPGEVPSVCYHDLGGVTFTEPFTSAAMDGDGVQMATKLRALAMEKYPDEADAVINVQTEQNSIGTIVTVKGEVVELQHGQTVECAMRKAPGVIDTRRCDSGRRNARRGGRRISRW